MLVIPTLLLPERLIKLNILKIIKASPYIKAVKVLSIVLNKHSFNV